MNNAILVLLGIIYFIYCFVFKDPYEILKFVQSYNNGDIFLSYFNAFVGFFTTFGVIGSGSVQIGNILVKITLKTETLLDDILLEIALKFINVIKYVIAVYVFFHFAETPIFIDNIIEQISSVFVIITFLYFLTSFVNIIFEKELIFKSKLKAVSKSLLPVINKFVVFFIWIIGSITIISNLGYDVSALIAGAGIGGLAVALAAKTSITNVFGAITILLNKPFKIGDLVGINGHIGTIKDIGLTYLTLIDKMGHQVMIPNEMIISTSIDNFTVRDTRRTDFSIGLIYGTTQEKMKKGIKIIEDILQSYQDNDTIKSYRVNFDMFGDFSLNINATYFSLHNKDYIDYLKQKEEINLLIKEQLEKSDINIAFPTQELILRKES